ncbi:hypothetical protein FOPG_09868 [Fusarium oxysporum f. sp. conglutinans race 2 54008]|uniref:Ubiquitin 3 binding protein But2 C-terminal domain-containing protein n=3 Tax=Fusarium oxysporum f. sp. conglutinans TaxID=100902 RepID=F9FLY5_FUSOF|nr:hypothetical protein FOXB_07415 [Fusarium oxysporum f. sp. conglutinans Fo5176]EXL75218.1 hypothetical protein FOPG_09868 [Fusarium oxysporum f. sp. conglutinans race 2 54008]
MVMHPQSNSSEASSHQDTYNQHLQALPGAHNSSPTDLHFIIFALQTQTATMPSITNMVTALVYLASAASALPANVARQQTSECATGTWYYSCDTNVGCFDHDPCANPTPVSGKTPDKAKDKPTSTTSSSSIKTIVPATLYDIYPEHPDESSGPVNGVHLETWKDKSQVEQVIIFKDIPAGAKKCDLSWRQGPRYSRRFLVKNSDAQADARPLSGFPENDVTYNSIKPFDDQKSIGGPNFSFWDDRKEDTHVVGGVNCAETLSFIVGLRNPKGDSQVYLEQDEHENGWTLTYH